MKCQTGKDKSIQPEHGKSRSIEALDLHKRIFGELK